MNHKNKKGQMNVFQVIFILFLFFALLAGGLGFFITTMSGIAMGMSGLTGLEGFIISNLLLIIVLFFIIAVLWWSQ